MRALVYDDEGLRVVGDRPLPRRKRGEALIRVVLAGICNTDIEITRGYAGFRGILGHEFVGVVEEADDPTWIGRRVVGEINCVCGECPTCRRGDAPHCPQRTVLGIQGRDGAMADYCALPLGNLHHVPDSVSDEEAVFVEPLAAALEITERIHLRPTGRVVVIGDGKLGLLVAQVLRLTGCDLLVVGHHERKLSLLSHMGVRVCLERDLDHTEADVVVDCTGAPGGLTLARRLIRPRGRLVLKSTFAGESRLDLVSLVVDEVMLIGSRCGPFAPALRLLERGLVEVRPLIERVYPLDEGPAAMEQARSRGALKVLLRP